jgi:Flp pilus assembly protein TadD
MRLPLSVLTATVAIALPATLASAQPGAGTSFAGDIPATAASTYCLHGPAGIDLARARAALTAGDYPRAVRLLAPLADGSRNPSTHLLAGYAHLGNGTLTKARRHFAAAAEFDRRDPMAQLGLGLIAVAERDYPAAQTVLAGLDARTAACSNDCARVTQAAAALRRALG